MERKFQGSPYFCCGYKATVSWCLYIKTSVLTLFFHGGIVTFLKRSKYFQLTMLSLLFTMQTVSFGQGENRSIVTVWHNYWS